MTGERTSRTDSPRVSSPEKLADVFKEFIQGDPTTRIYNFLYQDDVKEAGSGMESWNKALASDDYYVFRNEVELIHRCGAEIASAVRASLPLIELGIGSSRAVEQKTIPLIEALKPQMFVANDLSLSSVTTAQKKILSAIPHLQVETCQADFLDTSSAVFDYPSANVILTGSTISNITAYDGAYPVNEVVSYLRTLSKITGRTGSLIITQDTNLDEASLVTAYSSPDLIHFREDMLYRLKAALKADSFDPGLLRYEPVWNKDCRLLANTFVNTKEQKINIKSETVVIPEGRRLYVTNCYKYAVADFVHMARIAGFSSAETWMDAEGRVALHVLSKRN